MSASDLGPLDWRMAIVDHTGRPTPEFQRRWNAQRNNNGLIGVVLGTGAPTTTPDTDGEEYVDTSTTPGTLYVSSGGAWIQVGAVKFIQLSDAPTSYTGAGGKLVRVNTGATALEFDTISQVLDSLGSAQGDIIYRNASGWVVLPPGTSGYLLQSGGSSANPSWVAAPTSLPSIPNNDLLANTSGSTAVPVATTVSALLDSALGNAQGDIIYRNASGWVVLAPGTSGYVLTTNGSGANPTWTAPSSGSPANPTATASDVAVNGTATTYMRSDAAPAVQKASSSQFGIVKVDGTTVTSASGVISAIQSGSSVSIRGSSIITYNAASVTLTLPAGTVAGDTALVMVESAYNVSNPSGWTVLDNKGGAVVNGGTFYKTLTSGDISTGSVTVSTAGGYYGVAAIVTFVGSSVLSTTPSIATTQNPSLGTSTSVTAPTLVNGAYPIYFGGERGSTIPTTTAGATTLGTATIGSGDTASGILTAGGTPTNATWNYPSGYMYAAIVYVIGSSGVTGANPTATASDIAVNGTATTFMRSDAAPAVQKASSSQFGLVKVDGTTITAASGVISAVGGGGGGTTNNYYASGLVLLDTKTVSGASSIDFTSDISSSYDDYVLYFDNLTTSASGADIGLRVSTDNGATWQATSYQYAGTQTYSGGGGANVTSSSATYGLIANANANTSGWGQSGHLQFFAPLGTSNTKSISSIAAGLKSDGNWYQTVISSLWNSTSAYNALRILPASGTISGTAKLYGVAKANVTINPQPGLPVIQEVVTSGSQSSVTISSIPQTYRDLKIVVSGRGSKSAASAQVLIRFNGDTGANYDYFSYEPSSTSTTNNVNTEALAQTSMKIGYLTGATGTTGISSSTDYTVFNYAGTTFQKASVGLSSFNYNTSTGGQYVVSIRGDWRSTAAITSITIFPDTGNFIDGTVVTVYGIGGSLAATLPVVPPQGRLTLTSNTPVMTADATAQTTIYYTPYVGTLLPVGNIMYRFSQISYALNTTAHTSGNLYDIFAFNSSGTIVLGTGPAWTSSTARSNAISMDAVNGIWENTSSITLNLSGGTTTTTVAAGQATYLGTFYATANGQTGMAFKPTPVSGGTNNILGVYNAYNQVPMISLCREGATSWTYTSATWRASNNSNSNRISYVDGLANVAVDAKFIQNVNCTSGAVMIGILRDSTSADPDIAIQWNSVGSNGVMPLMTFGEFPPSLGFHYIQETEYVFSGVTFNFQGFNVTPNRYMNALTVRVSM